MVDASDLNTDSSITIAYDKEEPIVWVNTGNGDRGLSPDAARDLADDFERLIDEGDAPDDAGTNRLVEKLREYADIAAENEED